MPKRQEADARIDDIRDKFIERVGELWEKHQEEFGKILEEAEKHTINLTFVAALDFSESSAQLQTSLSFSQVHRDKMEDTFDDPNQEELPGVLEETDKAKSKRGRPRKQNGKEAAANDDTKTD